MWGGDLGTDAGGADDGEEAVCLLPDAELDAGEEARELLLVPLRVPHRVHKHLPRQHPAKAPQRPSLTSQRTRAPGSTSAGNAHIEKGHQEGNEKRDGEGGV